MFNSYSHLNTVLLLDYNDPVYRSTSIKEYLNALREIFIPTDETNFNLVVGIGPCFSPKGYALEKGLSRKSTVMFNICKT